MLITPNKLSRQRRLLLVTGAALVVAAMAAALARALTMSGGAATSGASAADDSLLASVLQGMTTNLASVSLGGPPPEFANTPTGSNWLYATYKDGESPAERTADALQAFLVAGGYGAQCAEKDADCIAGYSVSDTAGDPGGGGRLTMKSIPLTSMGEPTLSATIQDRLEAEGNKASSISFERPYGLAALVDIPTSDPQRTIDALRPGTVFDGLDLDGWVVRVVDTSGDPVYVVGGSVRAQIGGAWVRPGLVSPNASGDPQGYRG